MIMIAGGVPDGSQLSSGCVDRRPMDRVPTDGISPSIQGQPCAHIGRYRHRGRSQTNPSTGLNRSLYSCVYSERCQALRDGGGDLAGDVPEIVFARHSQTPHDQTTEANAPSSFRLRSGRFPCSPSLHRGLTRQTRGNQLFLCSVHQLSIGSHPLRTKVSAPATVPVASPIRGASSCLST
jgi:hypothetical protein